MLFHMLLDSVEVGKRPMSSHLHVTIHLTISAMRESYHSEVFVG